MTHPRSIRSLLLGFVLAIFITLLSYLLATQHLLSGWKLILTLLFLATLAMGIQLLIFINILDEERPRWNLLSFFFMLLIFIIIVGGSLWIMYNLNYNLMSPMEMSY